MHRWVSLVLSILTAIAFVACSAINPPSLSDIEEREDRITLKINGMDQLFDEAEASPSCQNVLQQAEERMEKRTALLQVAMTKMLFDSADASQRSEVYDLMGDLLDFLDKTERDLLDCIPSTPTPNPGEPEWQAFMEWFLSERQSRMQSGMLFNSMPRVPECSGISEDDVFGYFATANDDVERRFAIEYNNLDNLDFWESRYRIEGENPAGFQVLVTGMIKEVEDAMREACLNVLKAVPSPPSPKASAAPTVVQPSVTQQPKPTSTPRDGSQPTTPTLQPLSPTIALTATQQAKPTPQPSPTPLDFLSVSSGHSYTCGITTDGSIVCWGDNREGRATPPTGSFSSISAVELHICGVKSDNTIACWGYQDTRRGTPPQASFNSVSVGDLHACGVTNKGSAICWGYNEAGQADPPTDPFASISAGGYHTCGVTTQGSAVCWGASYQGRTTPPPGSYSNIDAGAWHTCGVRTDGTVVCWGDDGDHEEGGGRATPPAGSFISVSANAYHTCGVRTDGTVACWGDDQFGQSTPPSGLFTSVSTGNYHTCGVLTDGRVSCWGHNDSGGATPPR